MIEDLPPSMPYSASLFYTNLVLVLPQDRTIRLWNPIRQNCITTFSGHGYEVRDASIEAENGKCVGSTFYCLVFSKDSRVFVRELVILC